MKNIEVKSWFRIRIETNTDPKHLKGLVKFIFTYSICAVRHLDFDIKIKDFCYLPVPYTKI